jgi:hypothetical protein
MKKEEVYSPPPLPPKAISPQTRYLRTIAAFKTRWQNRSMKTLLAFFSGALVTTLAVVLAGGLSRCDARPWRIPDRGGVDGYRLGVGDNPAWPDGS